MKQVIHYVLFFVLFMFLLTGLAPTTEHTEVIGNIHIFAWTLGVMILSFCLVILLWRFLFWLFDKNFLWEWEK